MVDHTFDTEQPSWIYSMYFGNSKKEEVPIFLDAREQELIPVREYWFPEDEELQLLEYEELVKNQLQIFFLHGNTAERDNDYPFK